MGDQILKKNWLGFKIRFYNVWKKVMKICIGMKWYNLRICVWNNKHFTELAYFYLYFCLCFVFSSYWQARLSIYIYLWLFVMCSYYCHQSAKWTCSCILPPSASPPPPRFPVSIQFSVPTYTFNKEKHTHTNFENKTNQKIVPPIQERGYHFNFWRRTNYSISCPPCLRETFTLWYQG